MATCNQCKAEAVDMITKSTEIRNIQNRESTKTKAGHKSKTCQDDTAESKEDDDTGEKTGETKKRYRSEKQKERTRQYKKKIRRAKKKMMREKKLAEKSSNDVHMTGYSWSLKPQGPETGSPTTTLLQTRGNMIEQESKNPPIENLAEQVSDQLKEIVNPIKEADTVGDKRLDNMGDDRYDTPETEENIKSENIGVDKNISKENFAEQVSVNVKPGVYLTIQTTVDVDIDETIVPDDNTKREGLSPRLQKFEPGCASAEGAFFSLPEDKIESENTGTDLNTSRENLLERASVQLRPVVNITVEDEVDEARPTDFTLDDNTRDRQDIFGILSIYVDSGTHCDYDKDLMVKTSPARDCGYVYFSMKDFWK